MRAAQATLALFRVLLDLFQPVGIADDSEVESPVVVYAGLPEITGFVILLGPKRWMMKINGEETKLFPKGLLNRGRSIFQGVEHPVGKIDLHQLADVSFFLAARLRRRLALSDAIASSAVLNGP